MTAASDLATALSTALLAGTDFSITLPDFSSDDFQVPELDGDLATPIARITNADLTTGDNSLTGSGTFDLMMKAFRAHLKAEYEAGRITGSEYTKAYIACTETAMATGAQFLATRDATFWASVSAQLQAQVAKIGVVTARVQLENEKTRLQVLRFEALNQQATFALNKMRLATENVQFDSATYNLANVLPKQAELLASQIEGQDNQNAQILVQTENIQQDVNLGPQKLALLIKQVATQQAQTELTNKQIENIQTEIDLFDDKRNLVREQVEVQRAQTLDTRSDGATTVTGVLGKQKELYAQQVVSYKRDSEVKVAKIFADAWTVQKTIDEGLLPPDGFTNLSLDTILTALKTNNDLD